MGDEKAPAPLLPLAVRQGLSQAVTVSQRRFFTQRVLLALVAAAVLYCLAVSASSWTAPAQTITTNTIIVSEAERKPHPTVPPVARPTADPVETTSSAPFKAASTMKAETGPHQLHFRQPPKSVVVVRRGGDVQLDCRLSAKPHAIVTWYKQTSQFLTMGNRTYVDDERIRPFVDEEGMNWSLRIQNVMLSDAGTYSCHLALATQDIITVELDVIPMEDDITPLPPRLPAKMVDLLIPGYIVSPDICPNEGRDLNMLLMLASHPLYGTSRDRVRKTWATLGDKKSQPVVFGVGDISSAIAETVKKEAKKNNDIIYGKFRDLSIEPQTETVRRLAMMKWVIDHCRFVDFILIATHNEFVNLVLLKKLVKDLNPDDPAIYGMTDGNRTVARDPNDPLYLSYTSYQRSQLPEYASLPAYLISRAALGPLLEAAMDTPNIPHANILITGIAAEKAKIKRIHLPQLFKQSQRIEGCEFNEFAIGNSWGQPLDLKVTKMINAGKTC